MNAWYVWSGGKRWTLCEIISNVLGRCTVVYGCTDPMVGTLRREKYGTFVDAK